MSESVKTEVKRSQTSRRAVGEAICAAFERQRAGQTYGAAAAAIREIIESARREVIRNYARGDLAAARLAAVSADVVRAMFDATIAAAPDAAEKVAVCAVGGFGRGMLAPYSDIDLLFLHTCPDAEIAPLMEDLLYPLFDAGLTVGHSVHTPASAAEIMRTDIVTRTSFLDRRFLCGSEPAFRDFEKRFEKLRKRTKRKFFEEKSAEREARHEVSEQSRFLSEPNLKEGKGGLRDLHTMRWHYKYEYGGEIDDPKSRKKILSADDLKAFKKCERFLWSVRVQLHDMCGRAEETVSFDSQPALAERLGYHDRAGMTGAERLMKHYFVNAIEVGRLTRIFSAKIEEENARLSARALKIIPKTLTTDEAGKNANLKLKNGRLTFGNLVRARRAPIDYFRLFRAFSKRPDFDFHPDALAVVSQSVALVTSDVRRDPVVANLFVAALIEAKEPVKLLRVMAETGLLGKYIPSFGRIIGRIEYGLYRRFSIEETVYQSIGVLAEIRRGDAKKEHPIATAIMRAEALPEIYYVAVLLHEAIWSFRKGSVESTEQLIKRIARRLGLANDDAALAGWCAARHLALVRTAERRNLAESYAIRRFAEMVAVQRRLDLLLVLAVCHLRVVGAYTWDDWTRRHLAALYHGASAFLAGGDKALNAHLEEQSSAAHAQAAELLSHWPDDEREDFLGRIPDAIYRTAEPALIGRVGDLARAAAAEGAAAAVAARLRDGAVEALVFAEDRTGLLADLAGAVASTGASVRAVQVMTTDDGKAIDVFTIRSADGAPIEDADLVGRLHANLLGAAKAAPKTPVKPARRIGDRRLMFSVEPVVRLDLDASETAVVVEAEGRDRPGLLYELTAALAEIGVTIVSAHIATHGARAVDVFYLQDAPGYKITNKRRLQSIERRLVAVLGDSAPSQSRLTHKP